MWVLKSLSKVVVAGPFKSQTEMAKKLGLSHQYVNRQIRKNKFSFQLDGQKVVAIREKEFVGGGKRGSDKEALAFRLGVSEKAVEKVLVKHTSGVLETPQGKVKIQKLKPGEKPPLPAVRVLWNENTEKQDFVSFAAAAKELKIHPKTIPSAIKAGRNSFTRKSDKTLFTFEILEENTPSRNQRPKPPSEEQKQKWAEMKRKNEIMEEYRTHTLWGWQDTPIEEMDRINKLKRGPSAEKEETEVARPEGVQPPVPAPRRKNLPRPIPAPRRKPQGVQGESAPPPAPPAPRKKVSFVPPPQDEEESEEEEEETNYVELMEMKTWEILEKKYSDYYCPPTVGKSDDTIMVLFHPISGKYVKVRNYQGIEEFFQQQGYSSYLTEKLFEEKKREGEVFFQACCGKKTESWFRLILCRRVNAAAFEEQQLEWKKEQQRQQQWEQQLERQRELARQEQREREALTEKEKQERRQAAAERQREWKREQALRVEAAKKEKEGSPPRPPPEEVVEIRNAGQKINFRSSQTLSLGTFASPKSVAAYIRSGLRQKIFWSGPKTRQTVLIDNQEVYLPDLVKEIIVFHIREAFWKEGDDEAAKQWAKAQVANMQAKDKTTKLVGFMGKTRNLENLAIVEISRKLASFI